jgi:hypothetical protein
LRPARPLTGPADFRTVYAGIELVAPAQESGEALPDFVQSALGTARLLCWTSGHVKAGLLGAAACKT